MTTMPTNDTQQPEQEILTIEEARRILAETLREMALRKTSVRRAMAISRVALALAKVIEISDLKDRVEFLESALKKRQ